MPYETTSILLYAGAVVAALTSVIHSVFGERLIFRQLREASFIPAKAAPPLRRSHIRILWATWHLASVFGLALAALLFELARNPNGPGPQFVLAAACGGYFGSALLVLIGTRGRHPGWIALTLVGAAAGLALVYAA
jgi:hypothetical protein